MSRVVKIGDEEIHYDWEYGRITLSWYNKIDDWSMATGVVRVHNSADEIPGDYHSVATIIVTNGYYRVVGFVAPEEEKPKHEFAAFYNYLDSLGLKKRPHVRVKNIIQKVSQ